MLIPMNAKNLNREISPVQIHFLLFSNARIKFLVCFHRKVIDFIEQQALIMFYAFVRILDCIINKVVDQISFFAIFVLKYKVCIVMSELSNLFAEFIKRISF